MGYFDVFKTKTAAQKKDKAKKARASFKKKEFAKGTVLSKVQKRQKDMDEIMRW